MARNEVVDIPKNEWTLLTDEDVSGAIAIQNIGNTAIQVAGTVDATPPGVASAYWTFQPGMASFSTLAELFPGISATRLYVFGASGGAISISYG